MSDFGYGGRRFEHRRHHHWRPWDQGAVGDFAPPVLDDDAGQDFGCDPNTPGFRVFGQDMTMRSKVAEDNEGSNLLPFLGGVALGGAIGATGVAGWFWWLLGGALVGGVTGFEFGVTATAEATMEHMSSEERERLFGRT